MRMQRTNTILCLIGIFMAINFVISTHYLIKISYNIEKIEKILEDSNHTQKGHP